MESFRVKSLKKVVEEYFGRNMQWYISLKHALVLAEMIGLLIFRRWKVEPLNKKSK